MKSIFGKSSVYYIDLMPCQMVNGWDLPLTTELRPPASPPSAIYCNSMEYKSGDCFKAPFLK